MKVVILAGGRGKRLGVLSRYRPKPMLLIEGHPFLEYILAWLKSYGFTDIIVCSGYLSKLIEEYFGKGEDFDIRINYAIEKKPLGTAGALYNARCFVDGDFILLNGDSFINVNLKDMIDYHYKRKNKLTMAVTKANNLNRFGRVEIDSNGCVVSFSEKTRGGEFINAGLYICHRDLLKRLPHKYPSSLERDVFPCLAKGWIEAYKADKFFIDIGTVSDYSRLKSIGKRLPFMKM